jgi:2-C-methyl-D-erythritol 4-phosphate cytidylyltransferase
MRFAAIIVAAGSGERLGAGLPKGLVPLAGRPILVRSVEALLESGVPGLIVIAHPPGAEAPFRRALAATPAAAGAPGPAGLRLTEGGLSRQESVARGLALVDGSWDIVLVHDAARPLVAPESVRALAASFPAARAATLAVPAEDTTAEASGGRILGILARDRLWHLQTPQAFERDLLVRAHARAASEAIAATDDTGLVAALGIEVRLVPGTPENRKITPPADLLFAEAVLVGREAGGSAR